MTTSKKSQCTENQVIDYLKKQNKTIYIGPNLPDSKLTKYTVFIGGYPSWLSAEFDNETYGVELQRLFVPLDKLAQAQQDILTKGKPLYKYYRKVIENM